jgi:hypothetical protein
LSRTPRLNPPKGKDKKGAPKWQRAFNLTDVEQK